MSLVLKSGIPTWEYVTKDSFLYDSEQSNLECLVSFCHAQVSDFPQFVLRTENYYTVDVGKGSVTECFGDASGQLSYSILLLFHNPLLVEIKSSLITANKTKIGFKSP